MLLSSCVSEIYGVFYLLLALAAFSAFISFFMEHYDLNQELQSGHRVKTVEESSETRIILSPSSKPSQQEQSFVKSRLVLQL